MADIHRVWNALTTSYENNSTMTLEEVHNRAMNILENAISTPSTVPSQERRRIAFDRIQSILMNIDSYFDDITDEIESEDHIFYPDDIDTIDTKVEEIQDLTDDFREYLNELLRHYDN